MQSKKLSKSISRRESLKIGAGMVIGISASSAGIRILLPETTEDKLSLITEADWSEYVADSSQQTHSTLDWLQDVLVAPAPAAAAGGCQAGIYTPAQNGIRPWRKSLIRWLTSRNLRGNGGVLIRQEGLDGGAGLSAVVDPHADYIFEVSVHLPGKGSGFGGEQDKNLQVWASVLDDKDQIVAEVPVKLIPGDWATGQLSFTSGIFREVKCIVHAVAPQRLPCIYFAENFRLTRKDNLWWNPENIFNNSRTAVRLKDEREILIKTLDPDVVGGHNGVYLNWDGYFSHQGIAVGGGHWEQEYDTLSVEDPVVDQFRENGMARELDGKTIMGGRLWPGYHMCHNSPQWHSYQKQRMTRVAPEVQMISQDNICNPSFLQQGKGCFCVGCQNGFRDWLNQHLSVAQLQEAGIENIVSFNIVEYVRKVQGSIAIGRNRALADPVLRSYIQFSYVSQADRWRDSVISAKQAAGHPLAVHGNQYGAGGKRPYSVILSQISDVTCTETGVGEGPLSPQARAWNALAVKLGLAAGDYHRPVWLMMTSLFHTPIAAKSRLRMVNGQTWADGGVPEPWAMIAGSSGWFYDTEAGICRFVQKHRALFARRNRYANVGLVYSLPTHAWRNFQAFGLSAWQYQQWFVACAQLLEELHIPYEVNCWWHPLLGDDRMSMERVAGYKALVLPGVDCFSDHQRDVLQAFQANGGHVINVVCPELYDADAVKRLVEQTLVTQGNNLTEIKTDLITRYARENENPSQENSTDIQNTEQTLKSILVQALTGIALLETDVSPDVWSNIWLDDTHQVLALHMVNSKIDETNDRFIPVGKSKWRVRIPDGLKVTEALAISPDEPEVVSQLPVSVERGWATLYVPGIECYKIVALYSGNALDAADVIARIRRFLRQTSVKKEGQADSTLYNRLEKVLDLLRSGQVDKGATAAEDLIRTINSNNIRTNPDNKI